MRAHQRWRGESEVSMPHVSSVWLQRSGVTYTRWSVDMRFAILSQELKVEKLILFSSVPAGNLRCLSLWIQKTETVQPAFGCKIAKYSEFQSLLVYWLHRHLSYPSTQPKFPHNCVQNNQVKVFHRCRFLYLCTAYRALKKQEDSQGLDSTRLSSVGDFILPWLTPALISKCVNRWQQLSYTKRVTFFLSVKSRCETNTQRETVYRQS
jgi:hypothetical protein